jgi:hypothetical protein
MMEYATRRFPHGADNPRSATAASLQARYKVEQKLQLNDQRFRKLGLKPPAPAHRPAALSSRVSPRTVSIDRLLEINRERTQRHGLATRARIAPDSEAIARELMGWTTR